MRALCRHFKCNAVVVVGSQAILASWPDAPVLLRTSGEIDAYPLNAKEWEVRESVEASEEINALFGYLSMFHETHGFYIDGVDSTTATLPTDWRDRQVVREVSCDGSIVYAIAPCLEDIVISKLCRADESDIDYARELQKDWPFDIEAMSKRIECLSADARVKARALAALKNLAHDWK